MRIYEIIQTMSALSGLACLTIALLATKKQLKLYSRMK